MVQRAPEEAAKHQVAPKSVTEADHSFLDRYTPKVLNEVIRNLKTLLSNRAGLAHQIGEQKDLKVDPQEIKKSVLDTKAFQESLGKEFGETGKLSTFEKVFLAHFKGGLVLGEENLQSGQYKFLGKGEAAQQNFFLKMLPMTEGKKVPLTEVQEAVYRGLFDFKGADGQKLPVTEQGELSTQMMKAQAEKAANGTLISDLKLANGMTEKFTRIPVSQGDLLKALSQLMPGDLVVPELVTQMGQDGQLAFQALSHKIVNPAFLKEVAAKLGITTDELVFLLTGQVGNKDKDKNRDKDKGTVLSTRAEQLAAEALDLRWRSGDAARISSEQLAKESGLKGAPGGLMGDGRASSASPGGLLGLLGFAHKKGKGRGVYDTEIVPGFVPWYQLVWQKRDWKQKPKWFVILTYFTFFSSVGLFLYFVVKFLLQQ